MERIEREETGRKSKGMNRKPKRREMRGTEGIRNRGEDGGEGT